ncbi:hypothetical protein JTB14_034767 [Gonioctena quinquepunctata]|nr:hypothetical protein JTB14_034767 [Gonioctena quinquepunctata]
MFTELPPNSGRMDDSSISASGIQESSDDPESDQPTDSHAIDLSFDDLRISSRGRVIKPKKFPGYDLYFTAERSCPSTYQDAINSPDSDKWKEAMKREYGAMMKNQVWNLVDKPEDNNSIVSCKWVFNTKSDVNGDIIYKARLVAKGFTQEYGSGGKIMLNQKDFISKLISDFGLEDAKTMATPLEPNLKLAKDTSELLDLPREIFAYAENVTPSPYKNTITRQFIQLFLMVFRYIRKFKYNTVTNVLKLAKVYMAENLWNFRCDQNSVIRLDSDLEIPKFA